MILAAKVWCPADEPEPAGLFNKATCPDAPPHWFREEPDYAAELYALERGRGDREVHVLDTAGVLHKFTAKTDYELDVRLRAA